MNVIFLDFDGVLKTMHYDQDYEIEKRVKLLSDICKEYDCKIVVSATAKKAIDDNTLEAKGGFVKTILDFFKKYDIDFIGKTPQVSVTTKSGIIMSNWKEDEIISYLIAHPEIDHFCVIDDDEMGPFNSDLNKVRSHLVKPKHSDNNPLNEGLLEKHKEEVGRVLKLNNKYRPN